jgi:hypothetical protein
MIEQLESRTLFSAVVSAAGNYMGFFAPHGRAARVALGAVHVPATLDLSANSNGAIIGTLDFTNIGNYTVGGGYANQRVPLTIISDGAGIGTFVGKLNAKGKKLVGPLDETFNGQIVTGKLVLTRTTSTTGTAENTSAPILASGYMPNETPPPITSGISNATSPFNTGNTIGNQIGLTGGSQTESSILSNTGSILG